MTTTASPTIILSQYRVWVMRPTGNAEDGYTFPWQWGNWSLQPCLIVKNFSPAAGGMGEADLELLRQTRQDERDQLNSFHAGDVIVPRAWVALSIADRDAPDDVNTTQLDLSAIEWWGFLGDLPGTVIEGTNERIGMMKAKEVGHLFDQISLGSFSKKSGTTLVDDTENGHGWCQASADGSYPVPVNSPPTANIRTKDGQIIGNAKSIPSGSYQGYVFARKPEDCGTDAGQMWTRWRLMDHIRQFCKPRGLPTITITAHGNPPSSGQTTVTAVQSLPPTYLDDPPGTPVDGTVYLVGNSPTGVFAGHAGEMATWNASTSSYAFTPASMAVGADGGLAFAGHDGEIATWDGTQWNFTTPDDGQVIYSTNAATNIASQQNADGSHSWDSDTLYNYLNSTADPEVYELRNLKYRGGLEMLFPFTQGLDYKIAIGSDKASWVINIYSATESADYGVPAATQEDVDLSACENVEVNLSPVLADLPDEVVYEGACCLFGFTISKQNENFELIYDGGSDLGLAYDSADDWERNQPQYDDVYTLFQAKPNDDGDLRRSFTPGDTNTNDGPLIPNVVWNGTVAKLNSTSRCPYLPTARFSNLIPWEGGRKSDGTDQRDDRRKAQPSYIKPKVFYYDSTLEADQWAEITDTGRINFFTNGKTPEVSADDRAAAIRVRFDPKHLLAIGEFDGLSFEGQPIIDWEKMLVTIAMPSDQRVKVSKRRQVNGKDLDDAKVITRLTLRDESLGFWCMLKGTVVGIKLTDGEPDGDRITATNIDTDGGGDAYGYSIRNDWGKVERNAKRLAAWAFRARSSGGIELAHPDARPSWLRIGAMIGQVTETADATGGVVRHTVNAVIRSYRVTLESSPRVSVALEALPLPTFVKGEGSPSPSSGGAVSPNMGGTVPQAVQQLQARVGTIESNDQRKIIYPAQNREATFRLQIISGQTSNGIPVITYAADDPTLDQLYDPDIAATYPAGMGRAWLINAEGDHLQRVLVRHDFGADTDYLMGASPNGGWVYEMRGTRILTVASGDDKDKTMQVYLIGWAL